MTSNGDKKKLIEGAEMKDAKIFKDQTLEDIAALTKNDSNKSPIEFSSSELEPPRHQRSASSTNSCCSKLKSLKQKLNLVSGDSDSNKIGLCQLGKYKSSGYQVLDGSVSLPRKHQLKTPQQSSPSDYCSVYVGTNSATSATTSCGLLTLKNWNNNSSYRGNRNSNSRIKTPSPSLHIYSPGYSEDLQFFGDSHLQNKNRNDTSRTPTLRHSATTAKTSSNKSDNSESLISLGSYPFQSQNRSSSSSTPLSCFETMRSGSDVAYWISSSFGDSSTTKSLTNSLTTFQQPTTPTTTVTNSTASSSCSTTPMLLTKPSSTASSCTLASNYKLKNGDGLRYLVQSAHVIGKGEAEDLNFRSCSHAQRMLHRMEMFLHKRQLCDVILQAPGGRNIPTHRLVLAAASDYFAAMFTSELVEADQEEVLIKGVEPAALLTCVKYIYTGQLDLREDTVENVLSASCLLQLNEVAESCGRFLSKQLHPSNCIGIRQFADAQGCQQLYANADTYVLDNFREVVKNQEFYLLTADDMARLLSSDDICVTSEVTVFEALLTWAYHDDPARRKDLARLLAYVRLPLLPAQYIADKVASCSLFREDMTCQELIMESLKYHLLPERRLNMQSMRTRPRKSTVGVLYAVGGMDCSKGAVSIEMYDLRTNQWQQVANMNGRRLQFGVAVLDSTLYVVGGRDGLKTLNTVECFDPRNNTWTSMPSMATHRHGLGVGVLEGPMYAVGGHDGWSYLNTVERWDPQAKQWSYVASLSTARSTAGVAVLGNKLYAVGGRDGSSCLRSMECYDPHTNKWSLCSPMNKRRGGVGVAVCNEFLYAVGGHDAPSSNPTSSRFDCVERYDPKTDTWTTVAPISFPRDAVGACVLGEKLFAVGGYDGQQYLNNVECYDTHLNEWSKIAPLCVGRAGACVVHLPVQM